MMLKQLAAKGEAIGACRVRHFIDERLYGKRGV
jgi:hypothetical protein